MRTYEAPKTRSYVTVENPSKGARVFGDRLRTVVPGASEDAPARVRIPESLAGDAQRMGLTRCEDDSAAPLARCLYKSAKAAEAPVVVADPKPISAFAKADLGAAPSSHRARPKKKKPTKKPAKGISNPLANLKIGGDSGGNGN